MSDLVCLHHPDGRYLYVTPSSYPLLGYYPDELLGRDPYEFCHPDDHHRVRRVAHEPALQQVPAPITYRMRRKDGAYIWLESLTQCILDENGQVKHLQTTSREVGDRIKMEQQLKHDALHDGLTQLPNRTLLIERLEIALKQIKRIPEKQFAVLFLDLDNFKVINDSLGHLVGDQLLLTITTKITRLVRETDLVARLGGDEFVLLLEEINGVVDAVWVAERLLEELRSPMILDEREIFASASIGIVLSNSQYQDPQALLRDADLAMYRAKHNGRGQYAIFDPAMHLQAMQRLQWDNDLRKALEDEQFVLYYQPIVNLKTFAICGFEALIRWQHPHRGFVAPLDFIPITEETGLIVPLGRWILH
ncbi:MAG: diguanylate cyclase, partial [Cyanothece sp. SIO2G6]|nr:diguanylate cyclase [Cyanothece sp. SIO2G6]